MRVNVLKIIFSIWKAWVTNFTLKSYHISLIFSFPWFVSSIQVCTQATPSFKGTWTVQMNTRQKMSTTKMSMFQLIVFKKSPLRWCYKCTELTLPFHTLLPYCGLNGEPQWLTGQRLCREALFSLRDLGWSVAYCPLLLVLPLSFSFICVWLPHSFCNIRTKFSKWKHNKNLCCHSKLRDYGQYSHNTFGINIGYALLILKRNNLPPLSSWSVVSHAEKQILKIYWMHDKTYGILFHDNLTHKSLNCMRLYFTEYKPGLA